MLALTGRRQEYAWGSETALPELLGVPADGRPWAEQWYGAHPLAPAFTDGSTLDVEIARDPAGMLGDVVASRFDGALPFLVKLIAPGRPLSLQVHPSLERARESFAAEEAAGIAPTDPRRNYRDANHKPELLYALTPFEALIGFRTPRRTATIVDGLGTDLTDRIGGMLRRDPTSRGLRAAFRTMVTPHLAPGPEVVERVAAACARRRRSGDSPSPRTDGVVELLHRHHPGDAGVLAALLLNPVSLHPGEAVFVPPGDVHAYLAGVGVEVMAASDNVLRAGLTAKHVDADEMIGNVNGSAAPPMRIAGERISRHTSVFYAPVDDFELSITALAGDPGPIAIPGTGPRIVIALDGPVALHARAGDLTLEPGAAAFLRPGRGALTISGQGRLVQASVP